MHNQPTFHIAPSAQKLPQGDAFGELSEAEIFARISAALESEEHDTIRTAWTDRLKKDEEVFSRRIGGVLIRAAVAIEDVAWLEGICKKYLKRNGEMHPLSAQRAFDLARKHGNTPLADLIEPHLLEKKKTRKNGMKTSAKGRGVTIPHDGTRPHLHTRWSRHI